MGLDIDRCAVYGLLSFSYTLSDVQLRKMLHFHTIICLSTLVKLFVAAAWVLCTYTGPLLFDLSHSDLYR